MEVNQAFFKKNSFRKNELMIDLFIYLVKWRGFLMTCNKKDDITIWLQPRPDIYKSA